MSRYDPVINHEDGRPTVESSILGGDRLLEALQREHTLAEVRSVDDSGRQRRPASDSQLRRMHQWRSVR